MTKPVNLFEELVINKVKLDLVADIVIELVTVLVIKKVITKDEGLDIIKRMKWEPTE